MSPLDAQSAEKALFGPFELNIQTAELFEDGQKIRLSGQAAQLVVILVRRPGQLVTREELRTALWPEDTFVDFGHGLNNCISRIREAIGDSAVSPRYIQTLPKQGYRFIGKVRAFAEEQSLRPDPFAGVATSPVLPARPTIQPSLPVRPIPTRGSKWIAIATMLVFLAAAIAILSLRQSRPKPANAEIASVAVLPVANLSGDATQDYLTDGITGELITELAKSTRIRVISRRSVMQYKGSQKPVAQIAHELQVDALAEGTLKRTGDHVRITTHLISAADTHIWAESYDGDLNRISELEVQIASDLTTHLRPNAQIPARSHAQPSVRSEAYEEYLKGQYFWNNWDLRSALRHFERAIATEPHYAAAYGGVAKTYCRMEYTFILPPAEAFLKASDAIEKAFLLDPQNAEAHAAHSFVLAQWHWNWPEAESELQKAIAADPNNPMFHSWYSYILTQKGRTEEALKQAELAYHSDPASAFSIATYANRLAASGRYLDSIEQYRAAIELSPLEPGYHFGLADALQKSGSLDQAAAELEKAYQLQKEGDIAAQFERRYKSESYAAAADAAQLSHLQRALQELDRRRDKHEYVSPTEYVVTYAGMRDTRMTLHWLEHAYREHSHVMVELRNERFDFLRNDPHFEKLYKQVPFEQ
jgi:TolB-like protein/DNA-binding winged helix-turn-helix (wHTH) protein/Tfp pilus assembly protein PilF